jgi:hypothetical protein
MVGLRAVTSKRANCALSGISNFEKWALATSARVTVKKKLQLLTNQALAFVN